ncbi:amidohydrolase family protein [Amycolatopsis jiangsuensis]|uniref:Putative TIM-barrel fold metal-dependent hydrolase n=1 Tax=Amycolatopsis jiangsuensis TaxID=1181879 RepID=A0A840J6F4_9PSEU|nr:amidohydrolase family protein [Amycolatopsis jiangsuensis]MBB4689279.1 putative TIM-barrel fold metal-dependent hydrolase [Amycolatopsis jiangsuensis]
MTPWYFDTHTHAVSGDTGSYPVRPLGGIRSGWSRTRPVDGDGLIAELDAAGVRHAALVQASTVYGFDNRYAADVLARYPDRLVGVCSVDFVSDEAVHDLKYWIEDRGFRGVRIRIADGDTKVNASARVTLSDERMRAVWDYVDDHGVPVCVQMHSKNTPELLGVLEEHPALTIVLDHAGRPDASGAPDYPMLAELEQLARFTGVHLKITPGALRRLGNEPGADVEAVLRRLAQKFGTGHLMWGSDFPAAEGSLRQSRALVESALSWLPETERQAVLGHTAARVYGVHAG